VRQPLNAAQPGCICDHVLVNVQTSGVLRLRVSGDNVQSSVLGDLRTALETSAPPLVRNCEAALVYADLLLPQARIGGLHEAMA
jgi:hypothetical protein